MTGPEQVRCETILLVDDEPALRELVRVVLRMQGYRVLEAGSGREAQRLLNSASASIHLLLADVLMPDMDGQELAEWVRKNYPEIKILLTSGFTDKNDFHEWASPRGIVFFPKPFNVENLERTVREALDGYCPLRKAAEPKPDEAALSWTIP